MSHDITSVQVEYDVIKGLSNLLKLEGLREIFIEVHFALLKDRELSDEPQEIERILKNFVFQCKWADSSHIMVHKS